MRLVTAELFLCFAHIPFEASIVSFNSQKCDQIRDTVSQLQYLATSNDCTYLLPNGGWRTKIYL